MRNKRFIFLVITILIIVIFSVILVISIKGIIYDINYANKVNSIMADLV